MKTYRQETYTPQPAQPDRQYLHTTQAGAWLPFTQATLTGVILGVAVAVLGLILRTQHPETPGLVIGLLAWAGTWLQLQRHWFSLTGLEKLTGLDLDNNGTIGEPPEIRVRISEVNDGGHYHETIAHLPATLEQMQALAAGLLAGDPFSERTWTGSGRPFSVDGFRALRSELIKRGLLAVASPKDPRQGFILTAVGRQTMRAFISDPPNPA